MDRAKFLASGHNPSPGPRRLVKAPVAAHPFPSGPSGEGKNQRYQPSLLESTGGGGVPPISSQGKNQTYQPSYLVSLWTRSWWRRAGQGEGWSGQVWSRCATLAYAFVLLPAVISAQEGLPPAGHYEVQTDGADWHLKGEGVVCCPCAVPCPCRTNGKATYGHCEATLYLRIHEGHYGAVKLDGMQLANTSGACAMGYKRLAALYFDRASTREEQDAFMKLLASFFPDGTASFPFVRTVPLTAQITDDRYFHVLIPEVLEMVVDRNWGLEAPPFPMVAATDYFTNTLQYAQNIRYRMHDEDGHLNFNYSRRQANYRIVDLDASQYRSKSMLIQYLDSKGGFNQEQLRLIREQHLPLPDLLSMGQIVARLK